jgi:DNA-binding NarL/FixJ family response regulator
MEGQTAVILGQFAVLIATIVFLYLIHLLREARMKLIEKRENEIDQKFEELFKKIEEAKLSKEEKKVLQKINDGLSYKEIADQLNKSLDTVKKQMTSIHKKLKANKSIELMKYAIALNEKKK